MAEAAKMYETVGDVEVNDNEIAAWRFISAADLDRELNEDPGSFTPWFKMEWKRLRTEFADQLESLGV